MYTNRRDVFRKLFAVMSSCLSRLPAGLPFLAPNPTRGGTTIEINPLERGSCLDVVTFSSDGRFVATNERDPSFVASIDLEADIAEDYSNPTLALRGNPYRLDVWDTMSGKLMMSIKTHPFPMTVVTFSSDSSIVGIGGARYFQTPDPRVVADFFRDPSTRGDLFKLEGGSCQFWRIDNSRQVFEIDSIKSHVVAIYYDKDSQDVYILDYDGSAYINKRLEKTGGIRLNGKENWHPRRNVPGDLSRVVISKNHMVCAALGTVWSVDGRFALEHNVNIWKFKSNTVTSLPDKDEAFVTLALDETGDRLCVISKNGDMIIYSVKSERVLSRLVGTGKFVPRFLSFVKDPGLIVTVAESIKIWDIDNSEVLAEHHIPKAIVRAISIVDDRIQIAQGGMFMLPGSAPEIRSRQFLPLTITTFVSPVLVRKTR